MASPQKRGFSGMHKWFSGMQNTNLQKQGKSMLRTVYKRNFNKIQPLLTGIGMVQQFWTQLTPNWWSGGPISWSPRYPDVTPLDFFFFWSLLEGGPWYRRPSCFSNRCFRDYGHDWNCITGWTPSGLLTVPKRKFTDFFNKSSALTSHFSSAF